MKFSFLIPHYWQAIVWKIVSCLCFALINGLVRYLTGGSCLPVNDPLPPATIVFFQNVFVTLFLVPLIYKGYVNPLKTPYKMLHLVRVTLAVMGVVLWYLSLFYMPITQAVALNFTGPIFTIIGAYFLLKERLGMMRWVAVLSSFIGTILILRPDKTLLEQSTMIGWSALIPLISAITIAGVKMCSRKLATLGESPALMTTVLMVFMTPVSGVISVIYGFAWPHLDHWFYLILLGLLATCAHLSTGKSYEKGEVTYTMPFGVSRVIFSAAIGYWIFGEYPQTWTIWLGTAIILLSILLLSYQNYQENEGKKWLKATV